MIRQVTYEPMCIFKRCLWLLVENKLYGVKGEAVGKLVIGAIQAKDDGGLDQSISSGDGEKHLGSGCVFNWCLTGLVNGLEGERKQGIQDDCTEVGNLAGRIWYLPILSFQPGSM